MSKLAAENAPTAIERAALLFGLSAPLVYIVLRQVERFRHGVPRPENLLGEGAFIGRSLIALWAALVISAGLARMRVTWVERLLSAPAALYAVALVTLALALLQP